MIVYGLLWSFSDLIWYWTWSYNMVNDRIWSNMVFYSRIWSYIGSDLAVYGEYVQIWSCMWSYVVVCVRIWSDMIEYVIVYGRICWNMVKYDRVSDLIWSYMFEYGPIRSSMWSYMWSFLCCSEVQLFRVPEVPSFPGFPRFPSFQSSVASMPSKCWSVRICLILRLCLSGREGFCWSTL